MSSKPGDAFALSAGIARRGRGGNPTIDVGSLEPPGHTDLEAGQLAAHPQTVDRALINPRVIGHLFDCHTGISREAHKVSGWERSELQCKRGHPIPWKTACATRSRALAAQSP